MCFDMKGLLSLTLLLGALFGLFGQQSALAAGASWPTVVSSAATDHSSMKTASDCMEMMYMDDAPMKKPCTGLTLDCIAAMGCVVPVTLTNDVPIVAQCLVHRESPPESVFLHLAGRTVPPEPEPPTLLI